MATKRNTKKIEEQTEVIKGVREELEALTIRPPLSLHQKLVCIQSELKANKGLRNDFGKYNYRSNESILESVKPLLRKYDCTIVQEDVISQYGDRYYIRARSIIRDNSGDVTTAEAFAREPESKKGMDVSQITGACSSYARKYSLSGLLACDDSANDPDHGQPSNSKPEKKESPKRSAVNQALLKCNTLDEYEKIGAGFRKKYGSIGFELTGHNNTEKWSDLFNQHLNRVNNVNPFNANETPEDAELNEGFDRAIS